MPSVSPPKTRTALLFVLLACAAACLAVSAQSFWIDESETGLKAAAPTLHLWWHALYAEHNSNMQLPLYMSYIWAWARVFGAGELALRAANIPWFFLGLYAIFRFLRSRPGLRNAMLLLYCIHPFVWYYLNEARPYVMQLSGALLVCGALLTCLEAPDEMPEASWWWLFAAGTAILCGAGMLGAPWAAGYGILLARCRGFRRSAPAAGRAPLLVLIPFLVVLGLYFAWTVKERVWTGYLGMNAGSLMAIPYEQLGFLGLGPGRGELRTESLSTFIPYIGALCLLGVPLAWGLFGAARRRVALAPGVTASIVLVMASPVCLIVALGFLRHARILGRHLTPMFPFVLAAEAYALLLLWRSGRPLCRAAAVLMVAALALSSLEERFAPRHSKDDYRSAVAAAQRALAQGKTVWWAASPDGANFYHLPLQGNPSAARRALWIVDLPDRVTTPPDLIFISKPDLSDASGNIGSYIASHHYRPVDAYQSFTVWGK